MVNLPRMSSPWPWIIFIVFVLALLALDLGLFNRRPHRVRFREAAGWSAFWVLLSLAFNLGIYWQYGREAALQFFTSYLLEKSLSADNIFLFALIFASMKVPDEHQHRVLFWGVLGAIAMRGIFIIAGVQLVTHFHGVLFVFGAFLLIMGARLLFRRGKQYDPSTAWVVRLARKLFPISERFEGRRFFTRCDDRLCATPLLLVLIMIEVVDLTFAMDSIPAIFAVTQDAFIIFTSNILAILGLRALYFLLARAISRFRYLHRALAVILILIGVRILLAHWVLIPTGIALSGIILTLALAIVASLVTEAES
jgi:tellurite resistance protein TerC